MAEKDTRKRLMDTVKSFLHEGGDFTVKDIARRAYANVASVSYYFGDKDSLVYQAIKELADEFKQEIIRTLEVVDMESHAYMGYFLRLISSMYEKNKGVIQYLVTHPGEKSGELLRDFAFDRHLMGTVFHRMEGIGITDRDRQMCTYIIALSAFIFPVMVESQGTLPTSQRLLDPDNERWRQIYIEQLMKMIGD